MVDVSGPLDVKVLREAMADVVAPRGPANDVPRSRRYPVQQIAPEVDAAQMDWAEVDCAALEESLFTGFDVSVQWPMRVRLARTTKSRGEKGDSYRLAIVVHHIAADGESLQPLFKDLFTAYSARSSGHDPQFPPLNVQFADFALWQHRELGTTNDPDSIVGRQLVLDPAVSGVAGCNRATDGPASAEGGFLSWSPGGI